MTKKAKEAAAELAASSPEKASEVASLTSAIEEAVSDKPAFTGIAVMGSHPGSVQEGPFDHDDWLIYACSPHNLEFEAQDGSHPGLRYLPGGKRADGGRFRVDEWFEVHLPLADATRPYGYLRELEKLPLVWMRDAEGLSRIKGARQYPEKELKQRFGPFFFTSSIAFMLAKAIVDCERLNIPRIGIWGVHQASETEYCAAPETRALTADLRWVPVGDLKVGDELIAFDEEPGYVATGYGSSPEEKQANGTTHPFRKYRRAVVDATGEVRMPCYRFTMADGTTLVSSANHKWLNRESKWVESRHVRDMSQYPGATQIMKLMDPWEEETSWEAGYLAAAFDGEGHLTQTRCDGRDIVKTAFAQRDNEMRAEVFRAAESFGFDFLRSKDADRLDFVLKGGKAKVLEFLGRFRPPRLMGKFDPDRLGTMQRKEFVPVEKVEFIGEQTVIALSTTTGTFIAEGFASHNTYQRPGIQYFIQRATELGIQVIAPEVSKLFEPQRESF